MYQLDANNFTMIFSHKWPLHTPTPPSAFRVCYKMFVTFYPFPMNMCVLYIH